MAVQASRLANNRLHLQHGPIDLVIKSEGRFHEIERSYNQATARFKRVLNELVEELPELRNSQCKQVKGDIAKRMLSAINPYQEGFVTPMAAVAGAVADEVLHALLQYRSLQKVYVNNGGDIALYLRKNQQYNVAMADIGQLSIVGKITVKQSDGIAGIATSGWRGRSLSLGIADEVTVLAANAAQADVAATLIANAVNINSHPKISRCSAQEIDPDSDLKNQMVTTAVGRLSHHEVNTALDAGLKTAQLLKTRHGFKAALIRLNGQVRYCGELCFSPRLDQPKSNPYHQQTIGEFCQA